MIGLRKNRGSLNSQVKQCRSSMVITGSTSENIIQLFFGAGCFKGKDVRNIDSKDSITLYSFLCSLFAFSLYEFNNQKCNSTLKKSDRRQRSQILNILVLIDATKIPIKALRIILRACQSALAYKIRQAIIVEPEGFLGQQRVGIDILLDSYDFKTVICPKSKLWKYLSIGSNFYDINTNSKSLTFLPFFDNNEWKNIKDEFQEYFVNNTNYPRSSNQQFNSSPELIFTTLSATLSKFKRKDNCILIEFIENDLDTISIKNMLKNQNQKYRNSLDLSNFSNTNENFNNESINKIEKRHSKIEVFNNFLHKQKTELPESSLNLTIDNSQKNVTNYLMRQKSKHSQAIIIDNKKEKTTRPLSQSLTELKYSLNEIKNTKFISLDQIDEEKYKKNTEMLKTIKEQILFIKELLNWFTEVGEPKFAEIDVKSMPTSLICCYDFLNDNESNELSYDFQIKQELDNFLQRTEEIIDKIAKINEFIENLELKICEVNSDDYETKNVENLIKIKENLKSDKIYTILVKQFQLLKQLTATISKKVHKFRTKLNQQTFKIKNYQRFRRAVSQFYKESDEMLTKICYNSKVELNQTLIQTEITALKKKMNCCEERLNNVVETGTNFCTILRTTTNDLLNDTDNITNVIQQAEIAQKMQFVAENLTTVNDRRKSCYELVKLRISRLKQAEEIIKCENFGDEIFEKLSVYFDNLQKCQPTFSTVLNSKKTEKRLYNYAKHLNHIAFVLRQLQGYDLQPNILLNEKLESMWKKLNLNPSLMKCG